MVESQNRDEKIFSHRGNSNRETYIQVLRMKSFCKHKYTIVVLVTGLTVLSSSVFGEINLPLTPVNSPVVFKSFTKTMTGDPNMSPEEINFQEEKSFSKAKAVLPTMLQLK